MRQEAHIIKNFLLAALIPAILAGCGGDKGRILVEGDYVISPTDRIGEYLKFVYQPHKRDQAYKFLTAKARAMASRKDFKALLRGELARDFSGRSSSDIRVDVTHLKDFPVSERHHVVYSLLLVSFPYDEGMADKFRLTRFHTRLDDGTWYIEPFIHRSSFTKRFVPSLVVGTQWTLDEERKAFYDIIGEDLLKERRKIDGVSTPKVTRRENDTDIKVEKIGDLVIPDLVVRKPEDGEANRKSDAGKIDQAKLSKKVKALIAAGELHFKTGNIPAAEETFRKVLELDKFNEIAMDHLKRCAGIREIEEERRKQIEIYEKLLELERKERELEKKSLDN